MFATGKMHALGYSALIYFLPAGSQDGHIRVWKASADYKKILPLFSIPVVGFVNSLDFTQNGDYLIAGVAQEHRLGRWWRIKEAKNRIIIFPLKRNLAAK